MSKQKDIHPFLERFIGEQRVNDRCYPDLHEHLLALAREGLLTIVDEPINKDTEMHPLVRWQYRGGIPEADRRAFLFTQPTDSKGKRFQMPVLVAGTRCQSGCLSRRIWKAAGPGRRHLDFGDREAG